MKKLLVLPLAGLLAACGESVPTSLVSPVAPTITATARTTGAVALVDWSSGRPALYVQNADGSGRRKIAVEHVYNRIQGNLSAQQLPVNESTIVSMGPLSWSPDGSRLAVVVSAAFDQSMVIIMNADGHNQYIASDNWQYIMGQVEWSPDGQSIAYSMSTLPGARGVDLFVTDLPRLTITRITKTGTFGLAPYRWDTKGGGLLYYVQDGIDEALWNPIGHIELVHVATFQTTPFPGRIVGTVQGIAHDGTFALVLEHKEMTKDFAWVSDLVRAPLGEGSAAVLATSDKLFWASLLEGDDAAVIASNISSTPYETLYGYSLMSLRDGSMTELAGIGTATNVIDVR